VTAPSGGRRGGLVAVLAGVTVIAVVVGLLLALHSGRDRPTAAPPPDAGTNMPSLPVTATPSLGREGAPTDLQIQTDTGDSVTLAWTDPTGGTLSYVAVRQKMSTDDEAQTQQVPPGEAHKTATFTGLNPSRNYCFTVLVVYTVTNLATSDPACTRR
jgi:hypothetical protein